MTTRNQKILYSIISLLLSIAAWLFVVYNYDPMTEVTYKDVPVRLKGESTLADRGYAVSDASIESIYVKLNQRRVLTNKLSAEDISVVADVSDAVIGDNGVSLQISSPDGTTVSDVETRSISVRVEDAAAKDMGIEVLYSDAEEDDVEPIVTEMSDEAARVVAAESVIDKVDKVVTYLSVNDVIDKSRSFTTDLVAIDSNGEQLSHVQIYPEKITYKASAGRLKNVTLVVKFRDDKDSSYKRTYRAPETITIKGDANVVQFISAVTTQEIDARYMYEDTELPLEYELPDGVYIANSDLGKTIRISVKQKDSGDTSGE